MYICDLCVSDKIAVFTASFVTDKLCSASQHCYYFAISEHTMFTRSNASSNARTTDSLPMRVFSDTNSVADDFPQSYLSKYRLNIWCCGIRVLNIISTLKLARGPKGQLRIYKKFIGNVIAPDIVSLSVPQSVYYSWKEFRHASYSDYSYKSI